MARFMLFANLKRHCRLLAALAALSFALESPIAYAEAPASTDAAASNEAWPFEKSDLPVDPAFRFGQLENGMRYIIRHNETPQGQGEVRLHIDAGSTAERDDELGYAHFIEHMAFNGSTHVPEGEMVKLLEREGLAFGADTNASTSFDATIYKLNLPRNDPELLDTALMLMRETASELTFEAEAVEREKGVILSEKRARDTYALRNLMDNLSFFYPSAHFIDRLPIGTVETLTAATPEALRGLYGRVYTPKNSALVVVGEFDPDLVEAAIRNHFADWAPSVTIDGPGEGPVDTSIAGRTSIYIDPALPERITASRNGPWLDEPDTAITRRTKLLRSIGYGIVNRRLQRLATGENPPFRRAGLGTSDVFEAGRTTNLVVDTGDGEWREGMSAAIAEYRRAMTFGFTQAEVDEQLANIRTSLENNAAGSITRSNATHTAAALALIEDDQIPTTPESALERFEGYASHIMPELVLSALNSEALPLEDPLLRFEGRTPPEGGEEALRLAWDQAATAAVVPADNIAVAEFAYTDFGSPGSIISDRRDSRLGIRELRFENGLRVNLKRTDLKRDRISLKLNIDGGEMLDTRDNPLATAMVSLLPMGGLGKHSIDELKTILAGRSVDFSILSRGDAFEMNGATTQRDLELQLSLLAAAIADPGYRSQGEQQYKRNVANYFASKSATPSSALNTALGGIVSGGDPRFTLQPEADYMSLSFEKLRSDIGGRLAHGALELALVGDFDEEQAIALVAGTLGALPARESDFQPYSDNRTRAFTADRERRVIEHTGKSDQALLYLTWPTRDDSDPVENMQLELLERVLRIELTDELRERLGQTYSPGVSASQSREYPGYGTFSISASLDPADIDAARSALVDTLTALRSAPIDSDIMLRARAPMSENLENMLKTNGGWMSLVDRAQTEPERIDRYLAGLATLEAITAEDLRTMAGRYLDPAKGLEITVLPADTEVAQTPAVDE